MKNKNKKSNKIKTYQINRDQLGKRPIGCILGSKNQSKYRNIVIGYIGENCSPILIKTNLNQEQFDLFAEGKLSKKELDMYI